MLLHTGEAPFGASPACAAGAETLIVGASYRSGIDDAEMIGDLFAGETAG
jgi:hypothetical protein